MTVTGVSNGISITDATTRTVPGKQAAELESEAFMAMLLAEMRNQNPFEPMKENELLGQMAQMNSVQELKNLSASMNEMNNSNNLLSAAALMGKRVSFLDENGSTVESLVDSVMVKDNDIKLMAGDNVVKLADIIQILEAKIS
jgi:flagellar basal-body rod modification protein FlgD